MSSLLVTEIVQMNSWEFWNPSSHRQPSSLLDCQATQPFAAERISQPNCSKSSAIGPRNVFICMSMNSAVCFSSWRILHACAFNEKCTLLTTAHEWERIRTCTATGSVSAGIELHSAENHCHAHLTFKRVFSRSGRAKDEIHDSQRRQGSRE